jgi:hypothetical protein
LFHGSLASNLKAMPYLWLLIVFFLLPLPALEAAAPQALPATEASSNQRQLVREVVENGLRGKDKDQIHWSYREVVRKDGRLEIHEVCQTSAGTIDRLIAINNQSLSPEQQKREDARVQAFLADPIEIRKERQKQREDSAKQFRMFATFPDAFRYEYAGQEGDLVRLKFEPDPRFIPSSRQEEVFHHLEGTMWIDPQEKQLARIDGRLTSEVRFAGGLLGHLDKGGAFSVAFKQLDSGPWVMAALHVEMSGRALLFKTISVQEERDFDDYRRVPDNFSLLQADELLEKLSPPRQSASNSPK